MKSSVSGSVSGVQALKNAVSGLAADYWADGPAPESWVRFKAQLAASFKKITERPASTKAKAAPAKGASKKAAGAKVSGTRGAWVADRALIMDELWGKGFHLPGGEAAIDALVVPLGLTGEMSVMELGSGCGAMGRRLAKSNNIYVLGFEQDEGLIKHGNEIAGTMDMAARISLSYFDPELFVADKLHHCILSRELFYRVQDKPRFFTQLGKSLHPSGKPRGQLVYTDYVLEEAARDKPAVKAWLAQDPLAKPIGLEEAKKLLAKSGLDVRVTEDLTAKHKKEILKGLADFALFLRAHPPHPSTMPRVAKEIMDWVYRVAAIKQGLKLYRFYAIKN